MSSSTTDIGVSADPKDVQDVFLGQKDLQNLPGAEQDELKQTNLPEVEQIDSTTATKSVEEDTATIETEAPATVKEISEPNNESTGTTETAPLVSDETTEAQTQSDDLIKSLENKVSSFWAMASQHKPNGQGEGLESLSELKQDILTQISSAKESLAKNETLQSNVIFAENKLKEMAERVKTTDVGIDFNSVSSQANKALDTLDSKLEIVEQQATKFVSLLTSFFSSMVLVSPPKEEPKEADRSFSSVLAASYGNSRYESDLQKLHTTDSFYLSDELDNESELASFDAQSKSDEINDLIEKYPHTLKPLMNKLMPEQISYSTFWYRYFKREQQLKQQEESRKKLLSTPKKTLRKLLDGSNKLAETEKAGNDDNEDDDDFTWDDEEDEEFLEAV